MGCRAYTVDNNYEVYTVKQITRINSGTYEGGWFIRRNGYQLALIITKEGYILDNAPGLNPIRWLEWYFWIMPLRELLMWRSGYNRKGNIRIVRRGRD